MRPATRLYGSLCVVLPLISFGCAAEYDVSVQVEPRTLLEEASVVEVSVVPNCAAQSAVGRVFGDPLVRFAPGESAPALGSVSHGDHGLFARLVDSSCRVIAHGCQPIHVDGSGGLLRVSVSAASGSACGFGETCSNGVCSGGVEDASVPDGVVLDSNGSDGTVSAVDGAAADGVSADGAVADAVIADAPDDATPDAGPDAPTSGCAAYPDALVCDEFNDPAFLAWDVRNANNGSLLLTDQARSAPTALESSINAADGEAFLTLVLDPPISSGELYVRMHVYVPAAAPIRSLGLLSVIEGVEPFDAILMQLLESSTYGYVGPAATQDHSGPAIPRDAWTCVQMALEIHETNGLFEVRYDGTGVLSASPINTALPAGITFVRVGIETKSPLQGAATLLIDDVVVSTTPVSCD